MSRTGIFSEKKKYAKKKPPVSFYELQDFSCKFGFFPGFSVYFFLKNRYNRKVSVSTVSVFLLYLFTSVGIPQESE